MPQISIVIVNYNVKHFLELCLLSVREASRYLQVEVWVVDNNSQDGSCELVKEHFPEVKLIENIDNPGFGKANNQAIKLSTGKYVLLLNPDTIVTESTLRRCYDFMEAHVDAGALGVHMIDGRGDFLRESKRALPTPQVSFFKIVGLSSIFPHSKIFAQYHLGFLDKKQTHRVDILSGAFMFMRKQVLDEIGLFDEAFFMYGEDIDLSYRVLLAGYHNYYLGGTQIIHFKGESTKKGSLNYVRVFYKAMEIFARKHFTGHGVSPIRFVIESAIWLRAFLAMVKRLGRFVCLPIVQSYGRLKRKVRVLSPIAEKVAVVAQKDEFERVSALLQQSGPTTVCLHVLPGELLSDAQWLRVLQNKKGLTTVVLCLANLSCADVVTCTALLSPFDFKILMLAPNGSVTVGSRSTGN